MRIPHGLLKILIAISVALGVLLVVMSVPRTQPVSESSTQPSPPKQPLLQRVVQNFERRKNDLSDGKCTGSGVPYKLSVSPMKPEDFSMIIPYGLMIGGHVTPIDHQYFAPKDYNSPRDAYDVRAMADSRIVSIQPRTDTRGTEYRMVFTVSCTFLYYYDLVTSLAPDIKAAYDAADDGSGRYTRGVDIPVKAGQVIGRIGGQTLDFAVWDTTKKLTGFIVPEHYREESWKINTVDPLDYYTDELKALALSKYIRSVPPISGKIDYDVDGKLIGNWFLEGTDGYRGLKTTDPGNYWKTHLAFAPDHLDPTRFVVSMGEDWNGRAEQYLDADNSPDPITVTPATGLVTFDLLKWTYHTSDGELWDRQNIVTDLRAEGFLPVLGCALVQMVETRKIKFEARRGPCTSEISFSPAAKNYTR
ncbi:hypothetical protein HY479_04195 [Candidatus Uhrbacteria bacterium]|nr:hypothetical protein [Candidatus Uhrbacteria bacterium]